MFSQQHLRQLSASPPPFSFSSSNYGSLNSPATPQFSQAYLSPPFMTTDLPSYLSYLPALNQGLPSTWPASKPIPAKQECFGEDDMNPFSVSYASMAGGVNIPYTGGYQEQPLLDVRPRLDSSRVFPSIDPHQRINPGLTTQHRHPSSQIHASTRAPAHQES